MNDRDEYLGGENDRANALLAFAKLEEAMRLIEEALKQRPSLDVLQLEPMLRSLAQGLRILAAKDSELELSELIVKHGWKVGQRFFVRAIFKATDTGHFVVSADQDLPEGVVIVGASRHVSQFCDGSRVALDLEIKRKHARIEWHIRAIDQE